MSKKRIILSILLIGGVIIILASVRYVNIYKEKVQIQNPTLSEVTIHHASTSTIQKYLDEGQFQKAYQEAVNYAKDNPNNPIAIEYLGLTLFQTGRYKESIDQFNLVLSEGNLASSTQAQINYFIGRDYFVLKNYDYAISYYNKALNLNPHLYQALDGLAVVAMQNKNYQKAIGLLQKELLYIPNPEQNPLATFPYYNLAKSYFNIKDYDKAEQSVNMAEKLVKGLTKPEPILLKQDIQKLKTEIEEKITD